MAKVLESSKRGEWYFIKGVASDGKVVTGEVHAAYVEGKGERHGREVLARTLDIVREYEKQS